MAQPEPYVNGLRKRELPTHSDDGKRRLRAKPETVYDTIARDANGKVRTQTHRTRREAEAWLNKARSDRDRGIITGPARGGDTLDEYWPIHFEKRKIGARNVKAKKLAPRSIAYYEALYKTHISPTFGKRKLGKITTDDVRAWRAEIANTAESTAAKAFRNLSEIMAAAVEDNRIQKNPCTPIKGGGAEPKAQRPEVESEDVHALAAELPEHLQMLVLIAGFIGLRRGELFALKRRHYDQLNRRLYVAEAITIIPGTGERLTTEPKAESSRWIPVPSELAEAISHHLDTFVGPDADALLFVGDHGGPLSLTVWQSRWTAARKKLELDHVHLHDLRHHAGTMNAEHGATLKENMARLGHSTPDAALRYQHNTERRQTELSERLDATFAASKTDRRRANVTPLKPASDG